MSSVQVPRRGPETALWISLVVAAGAALAVLALIGVLPTERVRELLLFDGLAVVSASILARLTCAER